jgi:hypothetical protein
MHFSWCTLRSLVYPSVIAGNFNTVFDHRAGDTPLTTVTDDSVLFNCAFNSTPLPRITIRDNAISNLRRLPGQLIVPAGSDLLRLIVLQSVWKPGGDLQI